MSFRISRGKHCLGACACGCGKSGPLDIILGENQLDADKIMRDIFPISQRGREKSGRTQNLAWWKRPSAAWCPAFPRKNARAIRSSLRWEPYCQLPVDKEAFRGGIPDIKSDSFHTLLFRLSPPQAVRAQYGPCDLARPWLAEGI